MAEQQEPLSIQDAMQQVTAPAGAAPKTNDFASSMNDVFKDANEKFTVAEQKPDSPLRASGPGVQFYNADDAAKYQLQSDFDPWGFNPNNPANYDRMVAKEDWGSALSKGWDGLKTNFGNTYVGNFTGYGRMVDAIAHMDMSRLMDDESSLIDQAYQQKQMSNKDFVFVKPEEEDNIFGKKFVAESMQSAGFSLGTVAAFGTEMLADALITAATAGGGIETFGASIAKLGAKIGMETAAKGLGKSISAIGKVAKGFTEVESLSKGALKTVDEGVDVLTKLKSAAINPTIRKEVINETFDAMSKTLSHMSNPNKIGEWSMKALEHTPLLGTGVKFGKGIRAAAKGGAGAAELIGMGLGATRRVMQEYNMASTEANMEAVSSYSDTMDDMIQHYKANNNGETPSELEFASMRSDAMKSAGANYKTNMAVLLAMNSLEFGNVLNKYGSANKFIRDFMMEGAENVLDVTGKQVVKAAGKAAVKEAVKEGVKEGVEQAGKVAAKEVVKETTEKTIGKTLTKLYEKGAFGTLGVLGQVARDFGKKEAAYQLGRSLIRNTAKFEVLEGVQENLQDISSQGWKNYYASKHDTAVRTIYDTFSEAMGDQMTKQGFRTFLSGALGGVLSHGPSMIMNRTIAKASEAASSLNYRNDPSQNPATQAKEALKANIAQLNSLFEQTSSSTIDKSLFNFANQIQASKDMTKAAAKNQQYEFVNGRENSVLSAVIAAKQTGTVDVLARSFREMGKNMTDEQFENNFGISLKDTKYNSAEDFTNSIGDDIEKYSESIDDVKRNVGDMANPNLYKVGSKEYYLAIHKRRAQEEAVNIISYNMIRGEMTAKRVQQLAQEVRANPALAHSADYVMRVLHNGANLQAEIGNVQSEMRLLKEQLKGEGLDEKLKQDLQKQLDLKKEHLADLNAWKNYFDTSAYKRTAGTESAVEYGLGKFVGTGKKSKYDEEGKLIEEFEPTSEELNHPEIVARFKKLLTNLNNQAGITTQMTDAQAREALGKVVDISRLNNDAKEYMQSVDVLYNPEAFEYATSRMLDGEFKFKLDQNFAMLENSIAQSIQLIILGNQIFDANEQQQIALELINEVHKSSEYTKLLALLVDPKLGIDSSEYARDLFTSLFTKLSKKVEEINARYDKSGATDISDIDYESFKKDGKVSEDVKQRIAQMLYDRKPLTDKMKEVYDKHKEDIDKMVEALEEEYKKKREAARGQKVYDNSSGSYTSGTSQRLYIMENDRRFAKDIIEYYETQDGQVGSLKDIVQKAIDNPLTHPYIKEGLKKLVDKISDEALIKFDSKQTKAPAFYNVADHMITMDPELVNSGTVSFEAVMFHELIHYFTSRELEKDSEFTRQIEKMYHNTTVFMQANNMDTNQYGLSNIDEFLAEAFTNPDFQADLNKIPGTGAKTMWQSFLDALTKFLNEALNIKVTNSMLTDVMEAVQKFIDDPNYNGAVEYLKDKGLTDGEIDTYSRAEVISIAEQEGYNKELKEGVTAQEALNKPEEIIPELQQAAEGMTGEESGKVAELIPPASEETKTPEQIESEAASAASNVPDSTELLEKAMGRSTGTDVMGQPASSEMSGAPDMSDLLANKLQGPKPVNLPVKNGIVQVTINDNNVYKEAYVFNVKDGAIVKATHITRFKNSTEPTADKKTPVANPIDTFNTVASNPSYKVDVRDDDKKTEPAQAQSVDNKEVETVYQSAKEAFDNLNEGDVVELQVLSKVQLTSGGDQGTPYRASKELVVKTKEGFVPLEDINKSLDAREPWNRKRIFDVKDLDKNSTEVKVIKSPSISQKSQTQTTTSDIEAKKAEGTNARGTTYKGETTEKDGLRITKYSEFKTDGRRISKGGRIMLPAEFIEEYNITDQDYLDLLEGATEVRIYEVREGKDTTGISIQATFPEGNTELEVLKKGSTETTEKEQALALDENTTTGPIVSDKVEVKGTEESGLQVVDTELNTPIASDIKTTDEANKIAKSFSESISDVDIAKNILDKLMGGLASAEAVTSFVQSAKNSLRAYNAKNKTKIASLSEYASSPKGMELLTNLAKKQLGMEVKTKTTKKIDAVKTETQTDLFSTENETNNKDLTLESLNALAKIVRENAAEVQKDMPKSGNLVVDTSSILDMIKDISSCNQ
jgi:hypothetical protein